MNIMTDANISKNKEITKKLIEEEVNNNLLLVLD